jgi:hypothetical protein
MVMATGIMNGLPYPAYGISICLAAKTRFLAPKTWFLGGAWHEDRRFHASKRPFEAKNAD